MIPERARLTDEQAEAVQFIKVRIQEELNATNAFDEPDKYLFLLEKLELLVLTEQQNTL